MKHVQTIEKTNRAKKHHITNMGIKQGQHVRKKKKELHFLYNTWQAVPTKWKAVLKTHYSLLDCLCVLKYVRV